MPIDKKVALIRSILQAGRANDLLELMEGESQYTSAKSGISNASRVDGSAWIMALYHVRFVAKFGLSQQQVVTGAHTDSAFPAEFEHWLSLGAPGIDEIDVCNYVHDNPLPE